MHKMLDKVKRWRYTLGMMNTKGCKMIAWIGTICGIIGALLVAANNGHQDIGYGFFLIGSTFSLFSSIKEKHAANIALWSVFFSINIYGLTRYV